MTAENDNIEEHCTSSCVFCNDTMTDGIFFCSHPDSDHYCHLFMDDHPACKKLIWRKSD